MGGSETILAHFQDKAALALGDLSREFGLALVQDSQESFKLIGPGYEVVLYLYPSHIPAINLTIMPIGSEWATWSKESAWGKTGIWLAHYLAFISAEIHLPDSQCRSLEQLNTTIYEFVRLFRESALDLLRGNVAALPAAARFADAQVSREAIKPREQGMGAGTPNKAL